MSGGGLRTFALGSAFFVLACTTSPPQPEPVQDKAVEPEPADDMGVGRLIEEPAVVARGPKPSSASREERRQAVLDLLRGGEAGARLPEQAVADGDKFNGALWDTMTPMGTRPVLIPRIRQMPAEVEGSLDKDIVRHIVRAHIKEIRYCYNQTLVEEPKASGELTVKFEILATGGVSEATATSKNKALEDIAACVAAAFQRWTFPKPADGKPVQVSYPFDLKPIGH